jgi:hypothetical protein
MSKYPKPKAPGYVCPRTGRVAVLVGDLAESDLMGDVPAYLFNEADADAGAGRDPWRLIEQVDPRADGERFDVCLANGTFATVGPLMTVFLGAADAARLPAVSAVA